MRIQLVSSSKGLDNAINEMRSAQRLAIDLEFDKNRFRYGFNLCLVQIAAGDKCLIIDPLAKGVAVEALFPLLEDPGLEKVVFAFGEDLRLLHALGCQPQGMYELRTVASLLNYPPASLSNLLEEVLGVELKHSAQNSNWYNRPLSDTQIGYAADDVRYLFEFRDSLSDEAEKRGIGNFVDEENQYFNTLDYSDIESALPYRKKDKFSHSEFSWYVFEQLLQFRESVAEQLNRPSFQVFHKDFLDALAKDEKAIRQWNDTRGIHRLARNMQTRKQLEEVLRSSRSEANSAGLSESAPAEPRPNPEEVRKRRAEKAESDRVRKEVFLPLKQRLTKEFGEHASTFMLSNRAVMDLIEGDTSVLRPYKSMLLKRYAAELDLNVDPFIG